MPLEHLSSLYTHEPWSDWFHQRHKLLLASLNAQNIIAIDTGINHTYVFNTNNALFRWIHDVSQRQKENTNHESAFSQVIREFLENSTNPYYHQTIGSTAMEKFTRWRNLLPDDLAPPAGELFYRSGITFYKRGSR
jgi:hypothetical protein